MLSRGLIGNRLLELDAYHQGGVVGTGSQVVPEFVANRGRHRPEVALAGQHLTEGGCDVNNFDGGGINGVPGERALDVGGQRREIAARFGGVAGEIALVAAENPHAGRAAHTPHATPGRSAGWPYRCAGVRSLKRPEKGRPRRLSG